MPATEAVKTLAASFEGLGGATALSVIAFSVVFLVLAGLTLVIFAMRYVSLWTMKKPAPAAATKAAAPAKVAAATATAAAVASAPAAAEDDSELVAVITAAIVAQLGTAAVAIKSIAPSPVNSVIGFDNAAWIACGRIEGLDGTLPDRWN